MKKFLLSLSVAVALLSGFIGCSQQKQWNREQRQALRQMLRDYREMVYLENLTEAEYMLFAEEVAAAIETHKEYIMKETLAVAIENKTELKTSDLNGHKTGIEVERV